MQKKQGYPVSQWFLIGCLLWVGWQPVLAGAPAEFPLLRLETGMHVAEVRRISVDAENRLLATVSDDTTIRLWELPSGRLTKVLRVPVSRDTDGKLNAVALSPDGKTVVAGGYTCISWDKKYCLYIFDTLTGKMLRRISGLPSTTDHLAYSKDGRYLAVGMRTKGIQVYSASDYMKIAEDVDYSDAVSWAEFDPAGRLMTASVDGHVRIYDSKFKRLHKKGFPDGGQPFSLSVSPDGRHIAVGFYNTSKVEVLSGVDLRYLYSPDIAGVKGKLHSVAWSADGRFLYGGGSYQWHGTYFIRKWLDAGRGGYTQFAVLSHKAIVQILALRHGGVVVNTLGPTLSYYDAADQKQWEKHAAGAVSRVDPDALLVSDDGKVVEFTSRSDTQVHMRFSSHERILTQDPDPGASLIQPLITAKGLKITQWKNSENPKLNGKPLQIGSHEFSYSMAITPDKQHFVIGTGWGIHMFDTQGKKKWRVYTPSSVNAVNITSNGLIVVALGDGTIRWYRTADGKELLALFIHQDRQRTILWTPSGYYVASPGADNLVGWHWNNGKDSAADFFSIARLRKVYNRPDVVDRVLDTLDEAVALRKANSASGRVQTHPSIKQLLPPVVNILSPGDGDAFSSETITLEYTLRSPNNEPVTNVKLLLDGRPLAVDNQGRKSASRDPVSYQVDIKLPARDSVVSVIAENRHAASEANSIKLVWRGLPPQKELPKPKLYILAVGISKYADNELSLDFASKDARDFSATMMSQRGKLYRDVEIKLLTDKEANRANIIEAMEWIEMEATSLDVVMVFMAGHGFNDHKGTYYFLPTDGNPKRLKSTALPQFVIKDTLEGIAGKAMFFVDTCHSGDAIGGRRRGTLDIDQIVNDLASAEVGAIVFSASRGRESSLESSAWKNGAFTKALVEGLNGKADYTKSKTISTNELELYLAERVKKLTYGKQHPTTTKPVSMDDVEIFVY